MHQIKGERERERKRERASHQHNIILIVSWFFPQMTNLQNPPNQRNNNQSMRFIKTQRFIG